METTKPFADVLLDTPMERAPMVDHLAAYRARMLQRVEQADPEFSNNGVAPRSRTSLQYSSRSRGGLALQSGVQARLDLFPKRVTRWQDFYDEVGWDSFRQVAGFGDVPVAPILFRTNNLGLTQINEPGAASRFNCRFMEEVLSPCADNAPNGWSSFYIGDSLAATGIGHRVDIAWTREMFNGTDRSSSGIRSPGCPWRARFLVHKHKSPAKFPYGLTEDDLDETAQAWMQGMSDSLDEAKEVVNTAWEMACDDLVDFWELGERFPDREDSVRFRFPIIQIYVHMLRSFCKYGVLSTTDRTWFFKIDHDNVLHISNVFRSTGTGRESMRYAYTCMVYRTVVDMARLALDEEHLRAICQTDIRIGSSEWAEVWRRFGNGGGAGKTASGGRRGAALPGNKTNAASLGEEEALRELLLLKNGLYFPYA